jgi:hypothetical protein
LRYFKPFGPSETPVLVIRASHLGQQGPFAGDSSESAFCIAPNVCSDELRQFWHCLAIIAYGPSISFHFTRRRRGSQNSHSIWPAQNSAAPNITMTQAARLSQVSGISDLLESTRLLTLLKLSRWKIMHTFDLYRTKGFVVGRQTYPYV